QAEPGAPGGSPALEGLTRGRPRAGGRADVALRRPDLRPRRPLRQDRPDPVRQARSLLHRTPRTRRARRRNARRQRSLNDPDTETMGWELQLPPRSLATV